MAWKAAFNKTKPINDDAHTGELPRTNLINRWFIAKDTVINSIEFIFLQSVFTNYE